MKKSFSLIELTVALGILAVGILGVISSYLGGAALIETTKNIALASNAAAAKLEYIRRETFDSINTYNNNIFPSPEGNEEDVEYQNLDYRGIVYVNDTGDADTELKEVKIIVCWKQGGRTIGEDWVFEPDANPNAHPEPDSPVTIRTYMAER